MLATSSFTEAPLRSLVDLFARRRDRILIAGGGARTLDLLRLATVRSDDVILVGESFDAKVLETARRYSIKVEAREVDERDVAEADAVLVDMPEAQTGERLQRIARVRGAPVHMADSPHASDFTLLQFLERAPESRRA